MTEREAIVINAEGQPEDRIRIEYVSSIERKRIFSLVKALGLKVVSVGRNIVEIRNKKNGNHLNKLRIARVRTQKRRDALEELRKILKQKGIVVRQKPLSLKKRLETRVRRRKPV